MKEFGVRKLMMVLILFSAMVSCNNKKDSNKDGVPDKFTVDTTKIEAFFEKHPDFKPFQKDVKSLYQKRTFRYVWYDQDGRNDFAEVLYDKARQIGAEGVPVTLPYGDEFEKLFAKDRKKPKIENELLITSMYFFYAQKVLSGIDPQQSREMGWYLPRIKTSYVDYLEVLLKDEDLLTKDEAQNSPLYYNLRKGLVHYRTIQKKGGWQPITLDEGVKSIKPGTNSPAVAQLRKRLFVTGDISSDSGSSEYDSSLVNAVKAYQKRAALVVDGIVTADMIKDLNISVDERIKTIIVNMERCRWLAPDFTNGKEFISVNIPSYRLEYVKDGKPVLESNVVVGKELNETVVFSGKMSYLVFSPYWNIPKSIIEKEIKPGMEADSDYLEKHNMEWNDGNVRQKPGDKNSLGLVKFMFPNSNNIYLHDTPAKSLFNRNDRAFSHGCVRVEKARDLAIKILEDDKKMDAEKIDEAMHGVEEVNYPLKRKIPVYIAYFTAMADESGKVSFFEDIYKRDARLARLLYKG